MKVCEHCKKEFDMDKMQPNEKGDKECPFCNTPYGPDGKMKNYTLETFEVPGVEIFEAGTWNKDTYTVEDIDDMVKNFSEYPREVPVKLGHTDNQSLIQKDGLPAAGWVKSLRRDGDKLIADLKNVPRKVKELIEAKAYRKVSSEIWWNLKDGKTGKLYRRLLSGIALLGADIPAVSSLNDIIALYGAIEGGERHAYEYQNGGSKESEEVKEMEAKELQVKIDELNSRIKTYEAEGQQKESELSATKKELAQVKADQATKAQAEAAAAAKAYIEQSVKDGKILPKHAAYMQGIALTLDNSKKVKFTVEKENKEMTALEMFKAVVDSMPKMVDFEEKGQLGKEYKLEGETNNQKLDSLTKQIMEEHKTEKMTYTAALRIASEQHPELVNIEN